MNSRFLLALLTATTLVPAAASAQDASDRRGGRAERRAERPSGEAPRARAEFRAGVGREERDAAPQPRIERTRDADAARPRWQGGADRPQRVEGDRPDRPQRVQGAERPQWQGNRPDRPQVVGGAGRPPVQATGQARPDRPDFRRDFQRAQQGEISREQLRRDWQARDGRDGRDGRQGDWRQDGQRNGDWQQRERQRELERDRQRRGYDGGWSRSNGDRRDNDRYRGAFNDRRDWNRSWRSDQRYDWNRYRQSNRSLYRLPRYYAPQGYGYGYRRFGIGVRLNQFLFGSNYWINDPWSFRLPEAYGPYRWVRYYNDALLVDLESGQVVDVEYDIFW